MKKIFAKVGVLLAYLNTPAGRTSLHRVITGLVAIYVALHRGGV